MAISSTRAQNSAVPVFLSRSLVITGVGGGLLRDMMANETPGILRKHVYACASIAGAISYILLYDWLHSGVAMILSIILVVVIRVLAKHYEWNLPKAL